MKHVILGTAGHVDHGKTTLIKALTGIDTDRLAEEKKRGITIELGFAHLDFDDGSRVGIVDVPGHEKFIKNMLAGAGGIDLAMLIVAADEGFMPQTIEHLGILQLLGVKDGLVVITKTDMVDPEWVEIVREDVDNHVKGTFLEGKPVFPVSAYTGEGVPELRQELKKLVANAQEKNMRMSYRLPIDRVFSVDGFGTVVTGTLIEGAVSVGDPAAIMPDGLECRVRNLQVHGKDVPTAYAGQRVAINVAGVKKTDLTRGDTIVRPGSVRVSLMLDVRLENLKDSPYTIQNNSQVHFYHGSSVRLAKVILLDADALQPGSSCLAQLRFTEEVATRQGDRFVIRFYSPLVTIGGGVILDDHPYRHKRFDKAILETLAIKESGSNDEKLIQKVADHGLELPDAKKIALQLNEDPETMKNDLDTLVASGKLLEPMPGRYLAAAQFDKLWADCQELLEQYHKANPLHGGMKVAEIRQKLCKNMEQARADAILSCLVKEGKIKAVADRYALADFTVQLTKRQRGLRDRLLQIYLKQGLEVENLDEVYTQFQKNELPDCKQVVESMVTGGDLVMLTPQLCIHHKIYAQICEQVKAHYESQPTLTLAEFRDMLNTSRKYALAVLEYYDKNRILRKDGDIRYMGTGF